MKVHKGFAPRVKELASSTPREAIGNLLRSMLPRVPVATRPSEAWRGFPSQDPAYQELRATRAAERDPFAAKLKGLKRRSRVNAYRVIDVRAERKHRVGTWTYAMVRSVVGGYVNAVAEWAKPHDAEKFMRTFHGDYADRRIDWNWLAEQGYIEIK